MASPYQQQALRRKLIYIVLIVVLFTVAGIYRAYAVEPKADELALREQNVGEVEVGAAAMQLSLTGSRGFVICALWNWALDAQKKNRWNELELYTKSLTRLQPHFITPWIFQSWNLSYNVSVQMNQIKDSYFYISEGTRLLGEGERKNRNQPEMRYQIGFTIQHKIMQSDRTNTLRSLLQMSCIPPRERDPERFWQKDAAGQYVLDSDKHKVVNLVVFEEFCKAHPQLVRRLHDRLRCEKPADVVRFLEINNNIPSLYVDDGSEVNEGQGQAEGGSQRKPVEQRFPPLPPPNSVREKELARDAQGNLPPGVGLYDPGELNYDSLLDDGFDGFAAARAWFAYSVEALVPPHPTIPGESAEPVDRTRQRKSKMTVNLFRNHPPRAQSAIAERLQDEGWFGPEGWTITGWFPADKFRNGERAIVGTGHHWAEESWGKAHEMWKRRGQASHMIFLDDKGEPDPKPEEALNAVAKPYLERLGRATGASPGPEPPADNPDHEAWQAAEFMFEYGYARSLANFAHFLIRANIEMQPELRDPKDEEEHGTSLIAARRTAFTARQNYREGRRHLVAEQFESKTGLERLRLILVRNRDFQQDSSTQEEFYELELRYIKLMQDQEGPMYRQLMLADNLLSAGLPQGAGPAWLGLVIHLHSADESNLAQLPVPEFVPGYSNLMQDEREREKYKRLIALGNLMGVAANPQWPASVGLQMLSAVPLSQRATPKDQLPAVGKLIGGGLGPPMGALAGLVDLERSPDQPLADVLPAPAFVQRALMQMEAPGADGKPLISEAVVYQIRVRHGLLKPHGPPASMMGQTPPGAMPPGGTAPGSGEGRRP